MKHYIKPKPAFISYLLIHDGFSVVEDSQKIVNIPMSNISLKTNPYTMQLNITTTTSL